MRYLKNRSLLKCLVLFQLFYLKLFYPEWRNFGQNKMRFLDTGEKFIFPISRLCLFSISPMPGSNGVIVAQKCTKLRKRCIYTCLYSYNWHFETPTNQGSMLLIFLRSWFTTGPNNLNCLSLVSLSDLVYSLQVRLGAPLLGGLLAYSQLLD